MCFDCDMHEGIDPQRGREPGGGVNWQRSVATPASASLTNLLLTKLVSCVNPPTQATITAANQICVFNSAPKLYSIHNVTPTKSVIMQAD